MAVRIDPETRRVDLSVGDLIPGEEIDPFAPSRGTFARLVAGVRAHQSYARAQIDADPAYQREVVVRGQLEVDGWTVALWGRADGIRRGADWVVLEEVKSVVLSDAAFALLGPDDYPAYLLQIRLYLYLLAAAGETASGQLVFVNLPGGATRSFAVACDLAEVSLLVAARVRELIRDWQAEQARLARRRVLAGELAFPFPALRPHQAAMEAAARAAFDAGECLLVSAPPGLGKTAAALTAALRHALASDRRVFFVTSKTTEQRIVAATLARLLAPHPELSAVVLRAKAKICTNDVVFCHPEFCEFARDWPGKVGAGGSRQRLLALGLAEGDAVRAEGLRVRACPFELELDLSERADVVVGDYNYVFDPAVALRREFDDSPSEDLVLVIDEAHNLLDRARDYYSPALDSAPVRDLLATAQVRPGEVYRRLEGWLEALLELFARVAAAAAEAEPVRDADGRPVLYPVAREAEAVGALRDALEGVLVEYLAFRRASGSVAPFDPVLDLAFAFLRFARVLELGGPELVYLYEPRGAGDGDGGGEGGGEGRYRILCLDPARQLGRRLGSFHAVVAMSATLSPEGYYRDLLGFPPARTSSLVLPSPFARDNRRVLVVPSISTAWRERARYYGPVADHVRGLVEAHPGHWLAFFPSFAYLRQVEERLGRLAGELLVQREGMSDDERRDILGRLERPDGEPRLLLAVLGGAFAEGIHLPGQAVVGVAVVSPGLPQVSPDRELLRRYYEERFGRGFDYAYLVPGLNRVIQAAGRLVRSESDRGVVVLLDRRFATAAYARFFPRDWYGESPGELVVRDPALEVARFFAG